MAQPLVEDFRELNDAVQSAYSRVDGFDWQRAGDEAVTLYVETLRLPTRLFERLAERLEDVNRTLKQRQSAERGHRSVGHLRGVATGSDNRDAVEHFEKRRQPLLATTG